MTERTLWHPRCTSRSDLQPPGTGRRKGELRPVDHDTARGHAMLLVVTVALTAWLRPAGATVFVMPSDAELTAASEVILTGSVTQIRSVAVDSGALHTFITLDVDQVLKGRLRNTTVTIREPGGDVDGRRQWIHGTPEFTVGENVFLFLRRHADGTLGTTHLGLGKYGITGNTVGIATRTLDAKVIGGFQRDVRSLKAMTAAIGRHAATASAEFVDAIEQPSDALNDTLPHSIVSEFTFLGPARWNETDSGQTIAYLVDQFGEPSLGPSESTDAVAQAMSAWNRVPTAGIKLAVGGTAPARPMACDGISQIVFNDPFSEVPNPSGCSGILALGGFCGNSSQRTVVNDVEFIAITEANITFNNGFSVCGFWTKTNITEVLTHEIGHTIGLGHSSERSAESDQLLADATMYFRAHFDGRGPSLRQDDINAVSFVYPGCEVGDGDCDGIPDQDDNCPETGNPGQADMDGDTHGDLCDNCPTIANADQTAPSGCGAVAVVSLVLKQSKSGAADRLKLRGTFELPPDEQIDADSGALVFLLADSLGSVLAQDMSSQATTKNNRRRYRYRSADRSVKIKVRSRNGYHYKVAVVGKRLALRSVAKAPVLTTVAMGSHAVSAVLTRCDLRRRGRLLICAP